MFDALIGLAVRVRNQSAVVIEPELVSRVDRPSHLERLRLMRLGHGWAISAGLPVERVGDRVIDLFALIERQACVPDRVFDPLELLDRCTADLRQPGPELLRRRRLLPRCLGLRRVSALLQLASGLLPLGAVEREASLRLRLDVGEEVVDDGRRNGRRRLRKPSLAADVGATPAGKPRPWSRSGRPFH